MDAQDWKYVVACADAVGREQNVMINYRERKLVLVVPPGAAMRWRATEDVAAAESMVRALVLRIDDLRREVETKKDRLSRRRWRR